MGLSDSFQDFSHYQNSSYKTDPVQRDASSRNAEIYAAARHQREHQSRNDDAGKQSTQMSRATADSENLAWSDNIGRADSSQHNAEATLACFKVDSRGNVYRGSGSTDGFGWLKKVKSFFNRSHRHDTDDIIR